MSFFKKIFTNSSPKVSVEEFLDELFRSCGWSLSFDVKVDEEEERIFVDIYGPDEDFLLENHGQLLQALQQYVAIVLKRLNEDLKIFKIELDSQGFLEEYEENLMNLAFKLKKECLRRKKPVLLKRSLNAFYRRMIHESLTEDGKVVTESIGRGAFKTMKISPLRRRPSYEDDDHRARA